MTDEQPRARWNIVSVTIPFVGFVLGIAVGAGGGGILWDGHPMEGIFWGVLTWGIFCGVGLVAAVIAWFRKERWWGVTLAAFLLNGFLPMWLLCAGLSSLMNWLRYGGFG